MAENKKDSFTFSDKIKNSKPAFNPFSKRVPSKIGANGKPKKTLFERTKRDAPFFVAAAAALLMLPFLYKYSGDIDDGGMLVPPGSEDTIFDPERFGFDPSTEDPIGQIAQYTGRDSFDLIKGWGSEEEPPAYGEEPELEDWRVQDGLDDNWNATPSAPARSYAPAATRAAFRRTPTKINELGSASMNFRGGGGAIGRFGGANLKAAARQDSSDGPRQGVKPVSLQPLRAADNPSRSYFGQGGAAQARASRAAMGKSDAMQALADAMFNPVRSGGVRGGGLGSGAFGTPGGGGEITHTLDYKGITPWWWDMMKDRSQKAWEWKYFLWRRNFVEPFVRALGEVAATFTKGLLCCVLTGEDDCSMGSMWGTRGDSYQPARCECAGGTFTDAALLGRHLGMGALGLDPDIEDMCNSKAGQEMGCEWKEAKGGGGNLGFFGKRWYCLGNTGIGNRNKGDILLADRFNCQGLDTHNFELQTSGKANKWHQYHAVIAKNYVPFDNNGTHYLCGSGDRNVNRQSAAAVDNISVGVWSNGAKRTATKKTQSDRYKTMRSLDKGNDQYLAIVNTLTEGLVRDDVNDSCVIYVAEGGILDWNDFQTKTITMLDALQLKDEKGEDVSGEEAFGALHLYFVEGYAFRDKMSRGANETPGLKEKKNGKYKKVRVRGMPVDELPLKYVDFETYYVLHKGNSSKDKDTFKDRERIFAKNEMMPDTVDGKPRTANMPVYGKENAIRGYCMFSTFRIDAVAIDSLNSIEANLTFDPQVHGATAGGIAVTLDIPEAGLAGLRPVKGEPQTGKGSSSSVPFTFTPNESQMQALAEAAKMGTITAKWRAEFKNKLSMDEESYGSGEAIPEQHSETGKCTPGKADGPRMNEKNCEETRICQEDGTWGQWTQTDPNCGKELPPVVTVSFFDRIGWIPSLDVDLLDPNVRKVGGENTAQKRYNSCAPLQEIETRRLSAVDKDTRDLLERAKQRYDAANRDQNSTLEYTPENVTVANLLDAMSIVQDNIPLNAVCILGKTIGANSKDSKGGNNMFGTFAAFMGTDSSFFPTLYIKKDGKTVLDYRYYGCAKGGKEVNGNKPYHYGHYNWNHTKLGDQVPAQNDRQPFEQELERGMWKGAPLKAIADAVGFRRFTEWQPAWGKVQPQQSMDRYNRAAYHKAYKNVFQEASSCGLTGTMSYADVQVYVEALCANGADNQKPTNGNKLQCGSRFLADTNTYN